MKDISEKIDTMRSATAEAGITASEEAVGAAMKGETPKGAVWDIARAAGIMAAKKTAELIPYCHPIPIDHAFVEISAGGTEIKILATVRAVWRTGVEMEALTAVSVAALTVYDMLKPIDDKVAISGIRLVEKHGGKSDFKEKHIPSAAVLVTSDSVSHGKKEDKSGRLIAQRLKNLGVEVKSYLVVPDEEDQITRTIRGWIAEGIELVITTGGTGLGPRDVTVDAVSKIIERRLPGVAEAVRAFGQKRTPYAMLSRGVAGVIGKTVIVTLPGSSRGVVESMDAILPGLFHIYPMLNGKGH